MLEALTGSGLAAAAGLNAYIPLVAVGVLGRYTDWISLPAQWQWLENGWVLGLLSVLLLVEIIADKVPVVDHLNDVLGTVVRPTAGGLAFGATAGGPTLTVSDAAAGQPSWVPLVLGAVIALLVHGLKAMVVRPVANITTAGAAAPVVSTGEDLTSVVMSVVAILLPVLVLLMFALMLLGGWWLWRRRTRRKALRRTRDGHGACRPRYDQIG